jgi:hypothetical protein
MHDKIERPLLILGQIGGWAAGLAAYFDYIKGFIGFIGLLCGAVLSVWALHDRIRRWWARRQRIKALRLLKGSRAPFPSKV